MSFSASFQKPKLNVTFGSTSITASTGTPVIRELVGAPLYDGEYTVIPTEETQVLSTNGRLMAGDVTVAPIPTYYGRISWNGSVMTIT